MYHIQDIHIETFTLYCVSGMEVEYVGTVAKTVLIVWLCMNLWPSLVYKNMAKNNGLQPWRFCNFSNLRRHQGSWLKCLLKSFSDSFVKLHFITYSGHVRNISLNVKIKYSYNY